jgi:hypothetical protein
MKTYMNKEDILSKEIFVVGKHEHSAKEMFALHSNQEKSSNKSFPSGENSAAQKPSSTKKRPKKFNADSGIKSPQKLALAKKVKDNFKVAGNTKERDATKTLLEEHMMTI